MSPRAVLLPGIVAAALIGATLPTSVAMAQASQTPDAQMAAPAQDASSVSGVVVQAPPSQPKLAQIPPDKKAAIDKEAAKQEAWRKYRESLPSASDATLGIKDYPGLHSLLPASDDAAPPTSATSR